MLHRSSGSRSNRENLGRLGGGVGSREGYLVDGWVMSELRHTVVFKVVSGAIRNTLHGHPNWEVPRDFARSVAKRAAGTLAGMHPGIALAAARRSGQKKRVLSIVSSSVDGPSGAPRKGAARYDTVDARLLKFCQSAIETRIAIAKKAGDDARYLALCTAARIVKHELRVIEVAEEDRSNTSHG